MMPRKSWLSYSAALLLLSWLWPTVAPAQDFPWGPFQVIDKRSEQDPRAALEQLAKLQFGLPPPARPTPGGTPATSLELKPIDPNSKLPSAKLPSTQWLKVALPRTHTLRFERPDRFSLLDGLRQPLLAGSCTVTNDELVLICESGPLAGDENQKVAKYRWKFGTPDKSGASSPLQTGQPGNAFTLTLVPLSDTHAGRAKLLASPWGIADFATLIVGKWRSDPASPHTRYEFGSDGIISEPEPGSQVSLKPGDKAASAPEKFVATGTYKFQSTWIIVTTTNPLKLPFHQRQKSIWMNVQVTLDKLSYQSVSVEKEVAGTTYPRIDELQKLSSAPTHVLYRK